MKTISKRLLSAFLAFVMVLLMIPLSALSVSATEKASTSSMTPLQKYRAETTESLEKITQYIDKREAADEKLANSFGTKIGKINKVAGNIGKVANAALTVYNSIDPENEWYENVANVALNLVTSYLGIQLPGQETSDAEVILSEVQNMINDLEKRLGEEFDVVNGNIDKLSEKVDDNSVALAKYVTEQIDRQDYKDALNRFTDDFNYYNYKKELATTYEALITTINSGASEENIKKAYDNLYSVAKKSEVSKDGSAGLYDYIMGSNRILTDDYSIQEILYNYAVMKKISERENLEIECIEFAEDLYDTYVFSQYALILCYNYQLGYLYTYTENPLGEHYSFYSQVQENDVACSVILSNMEDLVIDFENVNEEIAQYVCYVSNLESSFIYESGASNNNSLYKVPYKEVFSADDYLSQPFNTEFETISYADVGDDDYYIRTNNKVSAGDTLYLNVMPELFASLFTMGAFYFEVDNDSLATVNRAGVVEILDSASGGSFTVTMYYNDNTNPMYSMTFEIVARKYHGGLGTEKAPYLIATWDDIAGTDGLLNNEADYTIDGIYFELTNDIDANGATFCGIPSFKGVLDGNGYSIHSFSINNTTQQTEKNVGFFATNDGIIKNLTIGNKDISLYDGHSVSIVSKATETSSQNHHSIGVITGKNRGGVYNCFVDNVFVNGELYDNNNNQHAFCYAGGITGFNIKNAVIEQCSVENSTIKCYLSAATDSGDNNYAYAGGIVGKNEGTVNLSLSHTNKLIRADARGDGKNDDNMAYPEATVGGLIGDSRNGSADNSATYNNILEIYGSSGGNTSPTILKGLYIGVTKNTFLVCQGKNLCDAYYSNCSGTPVTGVSLNTDNSLRIPAAAIKQVLPFSVAYLIYSYPNDTNECTSITDATQFSTYLTDDCWYFDSGYPTLKPTFTITKVPAVSTGGLRSENILEYYQGETNFKYITYVAGVAPEYRNETTHIYSLSSHRIDTSSIGETEVVILMQDATEAHRYTKETVQISIVEAEISEIYFYTMPVKTEYLIGDEVDTAGLKLFAEYKNDFCDPISLEDCDIKYDFSQQGTTNVTISYRDKHTVVYSVSVTCGHKNTDTVPEQSPTCGDIGYTAGTYCNECETYISGREEIPVSNIHSYGVWSKHNDNQHVHECECGEKEYEDHTWNDGVVSETATHLKEGIRTYTCTACSATKTEKIDKLPAHSYGDWTKLNDTQHKKTCACGDEVIVDHRWDSGEETRPATPSQTGEMLYNCQDCSASKTEIISKIDVLVTDPQIKISNKMAHAGETVKLDITMKNVTALKSILLDQFDYDNTKLELVGFEWKLSGAALSDWDATEEVATIAFNQNVDANGVIAELTFKVLEDTEVGDISISCTIAANEKLTTGGEAAVTIYVVDGCVTVTTIMRGDVNGDDFLDSDDAIYLLRSTLNPNRYPSNQDGDMNGDGFTDSDDAIYLLRHTLSPSRYPLS